MYSYKYDKVPVPAVINQGMSEHWISREIADQLGLTIYPANQIVSEEFETSTLVSEGIVQTTWCEQNPNTRRTEYSIFQVTSSGTFSVLLNNLECSRQPAFVMVASKETKEGKLILLTNPLFGTVQMMCLVLYMYST